MAGGTWNLQPWVSFTLYLRGLEPQPLSQELQSATYEMHLEENPKSHLMKCQGLGTNSSGDTMEKEPLNSYLEHFLLPFHTDSFRNNVT